MEAVLSNSTQKLSWFEITKMRIIVLEKNIVSFIIIFGTLSFPIAIVFIPGIPHPPKDVHPQTAAKLCAIHISRIECFKSFFSVEAVNCNFIVGKHSFIVR